METSQINPIWSSPYYQDRDWFHEQIHYKKTLLITVGDSWTWGDSLGQINKELGILDDYDHRTTHIYGYHLSKQLDSDWVNLAICGIDNTSIILKAHEYLQKISYNYDRIYLVFTLTESGRELRGNNFSKNQKEYDSVKGSDWPNFEEILDGNQKIQAIIDECADNNLRIGYDLELYSTLSNSKNIWEFLQNYENYTFKLIKKLFADQHYFVSRNFTQSFSVNRKILNDRLLSDTWVDIISKKGTKQPYPDNVYVLSMNGLDPILEYVKNSPINDKEQLLTLVNNSHLAINWLNDSEFNAKIATKHPLEQAHLWWAEYLYECIKNDMVS